MTTFMKNMHQQYKRCHRDAKTVHIATYPCDPGRPVDCAQNVSIHNAISLVLAKKSGNLWGYESPHLSCFNQMRLLSMRLREQTVIGHQTVPESSKYKAQIDKFEKKASGIRQGDDLCRVFPGSKP